MKNIQDIFMERLNVVNNDKVEQFKGEELNHLWFTSDTHFSHEKTRIKAARPFDNINEMDKEIIKQWNKIVKPNDIVYHLGDFGNLNVLKKLNGKVRLVMGNHEKKNGYTKDDLLKAGFIKVFEDRALIELNGKLIHMCHEPSKHIPNMHNLFGHVHDLAFIKPYGINIGVDVHHYRPVSYERMMYYSNLTGNGYQGEFTI